MIDRYAKNRKDSDEKDLRDLFFTRPCLDSRKKQP
jgi:hypothetical protein